MRFKFGLMLLFGIMLFGWDGARAEGELMGVRTEDPSPRPSSQRGEGLEGADLAQLLDEVLPQAGRAVADLAPTEREGMMSAQTMRAKVSPAEDGRLLVQGLFGVESKTVPIKVDEAVKQQAVPNLMTAPIPVAPTVEVKTVTVEAKK